MSTPPFVRFYANDWFTGVAALKADERGVYISMCNFIWTTGRRVPLDDAEASRLMALNFKSYQRVRDRLVVLGKVTKHENGYGNERAEHELDAAADAHAKQARRSDASTGSSNGSGEEKPASPRTPAPQDAEADKPLLNDAVIDRAIDDGIDHVIDHGIDGQKHQQNQAPFIEPEPLTTVVDDKRTRIFSLDGLQDKLEAAASPSLASIASYPGLLNLSTPLMWLDQGCDLERDVLPAVAEVARRRAGKGQITHWNYFTQAVANARAARLAGLPQGTIDQRRTKPVSERDRKRKAMWDHINSPEFKAASTLEGASQ